MVSNENHFQDSQSNQSVTTSKSANNSHSFDLKTTFEEKDKANRDVAFSKVIEDAKKLVKVRNNFQKSVNINHFNSWKINFS